MTAAVAASSSSPLSLFVQSLLGDRRQDNITLVVDNARSITCTPPPRRKGSLDDSTTKSRWSDGSHAGDTPMVVRRSLSTPMIRSKPLTSPISPDQMRTLKRAQSLKRFRCCHASNSSAPSMPIRSSMRETTTNNSNINNTVEPRIKKRGILPAKNTKSKLLPNKPMDRDTLVDLHQQAVHVAARRKKQQQQESSIRKNPDLGLNSALMETIERLSVRAALALSRPGDTDNPALEEDLLRNNTDTLGAIEQAMGLVQKRGSVTDNVSKNKVRRKPSYRPPLKHPSEVAAQPTEISNAMLAAIDRLSVRAALTLTLDTSTYSGAEESGVSTGGGD